MNELRVTPNAKKCIRIDYDSVTMSKNALGIWYESRTICWIGEFVAKVLNSSLRCVLEQEHKSLLSTGSTQEDPSLYNWKIVDGT